MSYAIPYTGFKRKDNHKPPHTENEMGNDGRKTKQAVKSSAIAARRELKKLTQRTGGAGEQQAMAALELYLQIPTFRRQGRRLSCR